MHLGVVIEKCWDLCIDLTEDKLSIKEKFVEDLECVKFTIYGCLKGKLYLFSLI
jgi:hypothetical protein